MEISNDPTPAAKQQETLLPVPRNEARNQPEFPDKGKIIQIHDEMQENPNIRDFAIPAIARTFLIGKKTLQRRYLQVYHIPIHEDLLQFIRKKAICLHQEKKMTFDNIAALLGYEQASSLVRMLHKKIKNVPK
jgi:AraC-like DNA-binding protein